MVQFRQYSGHCLLKVPKINPHVYFIQLFSPDHDLYIPVVAVKMFTIAGIVSEVMGG